MQKISVAVTVSLVFIVIASLLTIFASNSDMYIIKTIGTISSARAPPTPSAGYQDNATHQFIIRGPWIGDQTTAAQVDAYVAANSYATGVMLGDGSNDILSVISYTGWNASQPWSPNGGITYGQLQTVINRFHYYGWKVILISATQIIEWADPASTNYYTVQHPELIAVNGLRQRYDQINPGSIRLNFFATYTTPDVAHNITVGKSLMDVYCQRLSQMISDRSLQWDGWFGADGWNGLTNDGMFWVMSNAASNGLGTTAPDQWYFGDEQSLNEWGNSSYANIPVGSFQATVGTFGNSNDGVYSILSMDASHMYVDRFQCENTGNITSISIHTGGTVPCQVFVYSDNSGAPNALIGYGSGMSSNGAYATITLTEQAQVNSGSYYWLGVQPSVGLQILYNASDTSVQSAKGTNTYGSHPSTFPLPTYGTYSMDIYASVATYGTWSSMSTVTKSYWIQSNANVQWWQYWQIRFAQMFAEINAVFNQRPSDYKVGTIIATDLSSAVFGGGINCPVGMVNLTDFYQYDSFNIYQASNEQTWDNTTKNGAYVVGLTSGLVPQIAPKTAIEVVLDNWGVPFSEANDKMKYLSAAQTYVWVNGTRYMGCNPDWVILFMSDGSTVDQPIAYDLCPWITSVANILTSATPTYLGPVLDIPLSESTSSDAFMTNYPFAQFAQDLYLNSSGFTSSMGTVYLDAMETTLSPIASSELLQMFDNGSINIIFGGVANGWSSNFMGQDETNAQNTFHLTSGGGSSATTATTLSSSDTYGAMIVGNTAGETYNNILNSGVYKNATGFIPLIQYNDGTTFLGIYYNSTSGRFAYENTINTYYETVDQGVLTRAINWASNDPISINDSLVDAKIFTLPNGSIAISIMNFDTYNTALPITLNLTGLNLPVGTYTLTGLSNGSSVLFSDPSNVQTTLSGGADVLVISYKHS